MMFGSPEMPSMSRIDLSMCDSPADSPFPFSNSPHLLPPMTSDKLASVARPRKRHHRSSSDLSFDMLQPAACVRRTSKDADTSIAHHLSSPRMLNQSANLSSMPIEDDEDEDDSFIRKRQLTSFDDDDDDRIPQSGSFTSPREGRWRPPALRLSAGFSPISIPLLSPMDKGAPCLDDSLDCAPLSPLPPAIPINIRSATSARPAPTPLRPMVASSSPLRVALPESATPPLLNLLSDESPTHHEDNVCSSPSLRPLLPSLRSLGLSPDPKAFVIEDTSHQLRKKTPKGSRKICPPTPVRGRLSRTGLFYLVVHCFLHLFFLIPVFVFWVVAFTHTDRHDSLYEDKVLINVSEGQSISRPISRTNSRPSSASDSPMCHYQNSPPTDIVPFSLNDDAGSDHDEHSSNHQHHEEEAHFDTMFMTRKFVGQGAFFQVYACQSSSDQHRYAVKRSLQPLRSHRHRMEHLREINLVTEIITDTPSSAQESLHQQHLVRYYRAWQENGYLYMQLEYCNCNLTQWIHLMSQSKRRQMDDSLLCLFLVHVSRVCVCVVFPFCFSYLLLQGLAHIHRHNIVHLDIKPDNILIANRRMRELEAQHPLQGDMASMPFVTPVESFRSLPAIRPMTARSASVTEEMLWDLQTPRTGGSGFMSFPGTSESNPDELDPLLPIDDCDLVMKIGDFGQARRLEELIDADGIEGDCVYMAPELLDTSGRHLVSTAADIFSLGLCLLELATSVELPTSGPVWHDLREGRYHRHLQGCSSVVASVIGAMLNPDPAQRPTAQQILDRFDHPR